jgi:hypothetical protein
MGPEWGWRKGGAPGPGPWTPGEGGQEARRSNFPQIITTFKDWNPPDPTPGAPLSHPLFSEAWADALALTIDRSAAESGEVGLWDGTVLLTDGDEGVRLDLAEGRCRDARPLRTGDHADARVVFGAERSVWARLIEGELDPMEAVMAREIRLEKGSFLELLPHIDSARLIFRSVREVADAGEL